MRPGYIFISTASLLTALSAAQTNEFRWLEVCTTGGSCVTNTEVPRTGLGDRANVPADFDQDGDTDVLSVGPSLGFLLNRMVLDANGTAYNSMVDAAGLINLALFNVTDAVAADFDGDGDLDAAVSTRPNFGGDIWVLTNTLVETGTFTLQDSSTLGWSVTASFADYTSLVSGDFDGDGDLDMVGGATATFGGAGIGGAFLLTNSPAAGSARTFATTPIPSLGFNIADLAAVDVDGDGDLDLAVAGGAPLAPVRGVGINDGTGTFAFVPIAPAGAAISAAVAASDLDGDGDADLVFGETLLSVGTPSVLVGGTLDVFLNGGAGAFAAAAAVSVPSSFTDIAIGDIDEDGLVEIVASSLEVPRNDAPNVVGRTRLFDRAVAAGPFTDVTVGRVDDDSLDLTTLLPSDASSVALLDFDLDLDLDILSGHRLDSPGFFNNLRRQLDIPRQVNSRQVSPGLFTWDIIYDLYSDFGNPAAFAQGAVWVSLTPPTHVFPAGPFGILTNGTYTAGPSVFFSQQGVFQLPVGPFDAATTAALIGTEIYAQAPIFDFNTGLVRVTNVVQTTAL